MIDVNSSERDELDKKYNEFESYSDDKIEQERDDRLMRLRDLENHIKSLVGLSYDR